MNLKTKNSKRTMMRVILMVVVIILALLLKGTHAQAVSYSLGSTAAIAEGAAYDSGKHLIASQLDPFWKRYDVNGTILWCAASNVKLHNSNAPKGEFTYDNNKTDYVYYQKINYADTPINYGLEQSLQAGYNAYNYMINNNNLDTDAINYYRLGFQIAYWYSEIWAPENSTVNYKVSATTVMPTYRLAATTTSDISTLANTSSNGYTQSVDDSNLPPKRADAGRLLRDNMSNLIVDRAEAWANFYYGILQNSSGKLNISTEATDTDVYVDTSTNNKSYTQGPFKFKIIGDGNTDLTDKKANQVNFKDGNTNINQDSSYHDMSLGELVYRELTKYQDGSLVDDDGNKINIPDELRFCRLDDPNNSNDDANAGKVATVHYTDGTSEQKEVEFLDSNGNVLNNIPSFGDNFYIRVKVDEGETRTVESIDYKLDVYYIYNYTAGSSKVYHSESIEYGGNKYNADNEYQAISVITPGKPQWTSTSVTLKANTTMSIGGKVWVDGPNTKETTLNGRMNANADDDKDSPYAGMQVELINNGNVVATTTTADDGSYKFTGLDAMKKYSVRFTYNGQIYEDTYYKEDLSGGYSNAQDVNREAFNNKFATIDSSPNNYESNGWHQAYALETKLKTDNGDYISYNNGALTYQDAWNQFVEFAKQTKLYETAYTRLNEWLRGLGVGNTDTNGVVQYIRDCMITAVTRNLPDFTRFVLKDINNPGNQKETVSAAGKKWDALYTANSDQSRNVDFGIYLRDTADLAIQKDVYKATVKVNGKTQDYIYNSKDASVDDDGKWTITVRAADALYNGEYSYTREIRKSDYTFDGSVIYGDENADARNLQLYLTYRIAIRNQSTYDIALNEIVDYYDSAEMEYVASDKVIQENTFVGTRSSTTTAPTKVSDLTVTTSSTRGNGRGDTELTNYLPIYLSGIKDENGNDRITANGGMAWVYVTFKVKTENITDENGNVILEDRIILDQDVLSTDPNNRKIGKRNLAELNSYTTYYQSGATIPGTLNDNDQPQNIDVGGNTAGLVDKDSNVGNLTNKDLDSNGNIITSEDPTKNRLEDDVDMAPNVDVILNQNDEDERTFSGIVFEDNRNQASDKAVVGNGQYDNGEETPINGVTVQLVELVKAVDENGDPYVDNNGNYEYEGEYVWYAKQCSNSGWQNANSSTESESRRYYSGQPGTISPILSGPGLANIIGSTVESGGYVFKGIPAGDFFVRFIYGDTTQTTLTTNDGEGAEVVSLLTGTEVDYKNGYISKEGLNTKSYNGQDYKSTTYQAGVDQSQIRSFNGINGFTDVDNQNYNITIGDGTQTDNYGTTYENSKYIGRETSTVDGTNKGNMYYYDIGASQVSSARISDAKDVGNIRTASNNYSSGLNGIDGEDHNTLINPRAEVLASGLKVNTENNAEKQVNMLKEFMDNTAMAAQTGVINAEIEYNRTETTDPENDNSMNYLIQKLDLGLSERPIAQVNMDKEVSNMKITLSDGTVMFDTGRSVTNVAYAEHQGHSANYVGVPDRNDGPAYRLEGIAMGSNSVNTPELIDTYMDEELMYGARIELTYTFTATNIGEVDYMDNQFYYTGRTRDSSTNNISKTRADKVVDYVSNNIQFIPSNNTGWSIRTAGDLTTNNNVDATKPGNDTNLVNTKYAEILQTYNALVTTGDLGIDLLPEVADGGAGSTATTQMILSTTLTPDSGDDSMVYNNLAELVQVSNDQGRRMKFSIVGNQAMANQSLGTGDPSNPDEDIYTKEDLVTPEEPDADSSQKVLILPPTGANRNYTLWIVIGVVIAILIGGSIFLIKKKILDK